MKANRVTHHIPSSIGEDEREEYEGKLTESDPVIERLKGANEDTPLVAPPEGEETGGVPSWVSKIVGDQQQYNLLPPKEGTASYSVLVIKSLRWPGAYICS